MNDGYPKSGKEAGETPLEQDASELSIEDWYKKLETSTAGLTSAEAAHRISSYGSNTLEEKQVSTWQQILPYFWG
ncbi:MAG: hypothetical protein JRJ82_07595, partial [Deltaproteobacteria bacterium]|nr:hypothetical protein [Deltaproteobacteria bacterium]